MEEVGTVDSTLRERRWMRDMKRGERAAFDEFVAHFTPALVRYTQARLSGRHDVVQDIVQATLTAAVERLDSYRGEGPVGAWLFGICRFQIGTFWRRAEVRRRYGADAPEDFDSLESSAETPDEELEERRRRGSVHAVLESMPPPYGDVLEWKYLDELSVKEIAEGRRIDPDASQSRVS